MIQIEDLVLRYPGSSQPAVDGLSLRVPPGAMVGFLGPNGAGKSTTIHCLAGLLVPTSGRVRIAGVDMTQAPRAARAHLGFVPQSLALYDALTVAQNLKTAGALSGLGGAKLRERVGWGLALSQLEAQAESRVATLSGGMKRRLNLACSLLHDPPVILCDEPTTGVDAQSRNHLFETIRALNREGKTVLYTTHYMEEVESLCSDVAIIDAGKIIVDGPLAELLSQSEPSSLTITIASTASEDQIRRRLAEAGLTISGVVAQQRSLEELFLTLTGRALRDG